jgi:endonuclease III
VAELQRVHRVGRKLACMFVSALSVPALAPGLSPWAPGVDGNSLVVVDTNVARAVDALRVGPGSSTYREREDWIRRAAAETDLRAYHPAVPEFSPRLLQQALYAFCSKSNRKAAGDACCSSSGSCCADLRRLCPWAHPP